MALIDVYRVTDGLGESLMDLTTARYWPTFIQTFIVLQRRLTDFWVTTGQYLVIGTREKKHNTQHKKLSTSSSLSKKDVGCLWTSLHPSHHYIIWGTFLKTTTTMQFVLQCENELNTLISNTRNNRAFAKKKSRSSCRIARIRSLQMSSSKYGNPNNFGQIKK